jgi:hypothetical protein
MRLKEEEEKDRIPRPSLMLPFQGIQSRLLSVSHGFNWERAELVGTFHRPLSLFFSTSKFLGSFMLLSHPSSFFSFFFHLSHRPFSGSNGATLLGKLLELNPQLTALDISDSMIGPRGARALAKGIARNMNVCWLDLHSNRFYLKGAEALTDAIRFSPSLTYLNVSNCHIGFAGLALMTLAVTQKNNSLLPLEGE